MAHLDQELVTALVSEAVVDDLESVAVEEEHGVSVVRIHVRALDGAVDLLGEAAAVGEAGQSIVERVATELRRSPIDHLLERLEAHLVLAALDRKTEGSLAASYYDRLVKSTPADFQA